MTGTAMINQPFVSHSLSFLLGLVASYLVWWLLNHWWIPKLSFSDEIARYTVDDDKSLYVCAFMNSGLRSIIDVEVILRVGVKGFEKSEGWQFFSIKTNTSRLPELQAGRRALVRVLDERENREYSDPPSHGLRRSVDGCETLMDVFNITDDVVVEAHVFGYDEFSGARRHFVSSRYKSSAIRTGVYDELVVVQNQR